MTKTNTQIQITDFNQIQEIGNYGVAEVLAMKDTLGKDLTIPQFNLFVYDSVRLGLEPRLKHSFPILYGGKMDFRISFEGHHAMAQKSDGYIGLKMEVVTDNEIDDFYAETDDEGDITKVYHKIRFPRGKVVGSYAIAKREGKANLIVFCDKSEFDKYAKINPKFWKLDDGSLDPDMCRKHAGTRAIKGQFAVAAVAEESTESMYSTHSDKDTPTRRDITEEVEKFEQPQQPTTTNTSQKQDQPTDQLTETQRINAQIKQGLAKLGITSDEDRLTYMNENITVKEGEKPTLAQKKGLLKIIEMEIQQKQSNSDDELPV